MPSSSHRLRSIDVIRGAVMVLMAIDHVRLYGGVPAGGPTAGLFFTRWVTHFCAPVFVFLAGTSAFLYGRRVATTGALSRFLVTRGALLVMLELTVVRLGWTFGVDYSSFVLAGVIWMIGWCMILMAGVVRLSTRAIAIAGLVIVAGQSLLHLLEPVTPTSLQWVRRLFYAGGGIQLGANGPSLQVLYNIVPWIGVMMCGYAFGAVMVREPAARDRFCFRVGLGLIAAFVVLGTALAIAQHGDGPLLFRVLNQNKYRDSQIFLMMTLGPAIALVPWAERARGAFVEVLDLFGRVPLFYYLLHIPLIHTLAIAVFVWRGSFDPAWLATAPYADVPEAVQWPLPLLYAVWLVAVVVLYVACRWYAALKSRRNHPLFRYV